MKVTRIIILTIIITLLLSGSIVYMEPVDNLAQDQEAAVAEETDGDKQGVEPTDEDGQDPDNELDQDTDQEDTPVVNPVTVTLDMMKKVAENEYLELYFREETAEVAVKVKSSGKVWYTNPPDRDSDTLVAGANKNRLNSQLIVQYYNPTSQPSTYTSYSDSVKLGQFELKEIENGIRVEYRIGEEETIYILPKIITKTRMEEAITSKLDEKEAKNLLKYYAMFTYEKATDAQKELYPQLEEDDIYVLVDKIQDFRRAALEEFVVKAGYTLEDMNQDHMENGVSAEDPNLDVYFIPLEYKLDGENLVVSIPTEEIGYHEEYPIANIHVLPYFGAAGQQSEGYMLVPDGSGSLIYLNNNKFHAQTYGINLYGSDRSIPLTERTSTIKQAYLPVFGLKDGDDAFFSIIERGDAMANIRADISGRLNSYNFVYSNYTIIPRDELDIGDYSGLNTIAVYQPRTFNGGIRIRYAFLKDEDANYAGMAKYYRNYLESLGHERAEQNGKVPFYLETIGAINKVKSILGIPTNVIQPLTTYRQAIEIMEELEKGGVDNIILKYTGWANGGVDHTIPQKVKLIGKLGGKRGHKDLQAYLESKGYDYYPDFGVVYAYKNTAFDKFKPRAHASRYITKLVATIYHYNIATNRQDPDRGTLHVISPTKLPAIIDGMLKGLDKLGIKSISLRDVGQDVNSDFKVKKLVDRQEASDVIRDELAKIKASGKSIMTDGGNSYVLPYVDHILNMPDSSNRFNLTDESIPFMQMALRGYIDYAGEPINMSPEYRTTFLKAIETGSGIYFNFIYEQNSVVKETLYDSYYSNNYKVWLDDAIELYKQAQEALGPVAGQFIIDHEMIEHDVYKTTYENGREIIVNYNRAPVTVRGTKIEAQSFKVVKEGK